MGYQQKSLKGEIEEALKVKHRIWSGRDRKEKQARRGGEGWGASSPLHSPVRSQKGKWWKGWKALVPLVNCNKDLGYPCGKHAII